MGRCYEFGAVIASGCEHAMRVVPTGGRCECPTCGVSCEGRFGGCAAILSIPGYVPPNAPDSFDPEPEPAPAEQPGLAVPQPSARPPISAEDFDAFRVEMRGYLDEVQGIVDAALAAMTPLAVAELRPLTASKLAALRRRLAHLHSRPEATEPAPPTSD